MTTLERILSLLDGVRTTVNGYEAKCPAHDDQTPSLSLSEGTDGRVLLHCHAGCPVEAITSAIFQKSERKAGGGPHHRSGRHSNTRTLRTSPVI
jgi:hypothetical protein